MTALRGAELRWIGDNIGGDAPTFIEAQSPTQTIYVSIDEALRRIADFVEPGRERLLAAIKDVEEMHL